MGRAGGSFGGGGRSGGFSGGGRSSGGFSGGGGRSRGSFGGSPGGGGRSRGGGSMNGYSPRPMPPPPPRMGGLGWGWGWGIPRTRTVIINNGGGGGYGGPPGGPPPPERRDGCLPVVLTAALVVLVLCIVLVLAGSLGGDGGSVAASTVRREALDIDLVNETGWYTDELGWIANQSALTGGMRDFYRRTGVQPYLYLTERVGGSASPTAQQMADYADRLYEELFTDEAHFLVVFQESDGYMVGYTVGSQAKTVLDDEAIGIFRDYLDRYYTSDLTDEEYFSTVFQKTGERIMTVTRSPWPIVAGIFGLALLAAVLFGWWKKRTEQKNRRARQIQEMLNTPLTTFGNDADGNGRDDAEDLAEKYQDR